MKKNPEIIVIGGPTASGKSDLAFKLARQINGEIISADSMQIYKELNIGTAKPPLSDQQKIRYHLIDIMEINERMDSFKYCAMAEKAFRKVRRKDKIPILCGGTGFYIRSFLYGNDPVPANTEIREKLNHLYDSEQGFEKLKEIASEKNPEDFQKWKHDRRRLIRAMEVFEISGRSISEIQSKTFKNPRFQLKAFNLCHEREKLKKRIKKRIEKMLDSGWIEEAEKLINKGLLKTATASQALGYDLINDYLNKKINYSTLTDKINTKTWQFARRQISWFKNKHPEMTALEMPVSVDKLIELIYL